MAKQGFYFKTKWKDKGWADLRRRLTDGPAETHAKVGVFGAQAAQIHPLKQDYTVEEVALLMEFGSEDGHVRQRSFLRRTFWWNAANRAYVKTILAHVTHMVLFRKFRRDIAMRAAGQWGVDQVRKTIMSGVKPVNRPRTKEEKGHGLTLRHTMTLHDSISYVIMKGGRVVGGNKSAIGSTLTGGSSDSPDQVNNGDS